MPDRLKVGFWSPVFCRAGGTETWHSTLIAGLDRDRIEVVGLGVLDMDPVWPARAAEIERHCPIRYGPDGLLHVANDADVIVFWGLAAPEEVFPAGTTRRPLMVAAAHGDGQSAWTASVMLHASQAADRFVAVSPGALDCIPKDRRADAAVIPNGVDPERVRPKIGRDEQRRAWGVPLNAKVVGMIGRHSDEKNPRALAECVACLPPDWVGVALGDGPDMQDTISHAFYTAGTRVFFPGVADDIGSALGAIDVLLCPSHTEGFGYAIVEGWMAGVPVVSTPVGVAATQFPHPTEAAVFYPTTLLAGVRPTGREMAESVLIAHADYIEPERRKAFFDAARDVAAREFSAAAFCRRWSDFLVESACPSISATTRYA